MCYNTLFRLRGCEFEDVVAGIDPALAEGAHVTINYLNCPGFTDPPEEGEGLAAFMEKHPIHMIQWRYLNFDPRCYGQ
jgi:pyruvate-formate lyase-activating enzyme